MAIVLTVYMPTRPKPNRKSAMEFNQLHSYVPLNLSLVRSALHNLILPEFIDRRGNLRVAVVGPWRPCDFWPGSLERAVWTVCFESPRSMLFSSRGEERLGKGSVARRLAPLIPSELLARELGNGLVTLFSDGAALCYVLHWRERHLRFSLMLEDRKRIVRCDGVQVECEEPPRFLPEGDRVGLLVEGLRRWMTEPFPLSEEGRIFLPEQLASLVEGAEWTWIIRDGHWEPEPNAPK